MKKKNDKTIATNNKITFSKKIYTDFLYEVTTNFGFSGSHFDKLAKVLFLMSCLRMCQKHAVLY